MTARTWTGRPDEGRPVKNTGRGDRGQSTAPAPLNAGVLVLFTGDLEADADAITEAVGPTYGAIIGAHLEAGASVRPLVLRRTPTGAAVDLAAELGSDAFARSFVARMTDALAREVTK